MNVFNPTRALTALLVLPSGYALANDYYTEIDVIGDIPIVSEVSLMPQSVRDTPASVTIIDRQMISAAAVVELVDLFRLVPGFQAYHVNGNRFGVSYHGGSDEYPRRLEVMVDGRSVYETFFNTVEWTTLGVELEDIEQIVVVRGSNSPANGSNAFTGSINIVTRKPLVNQGTSVRLTGGDTDMRKASVVHTGQVLGVDSRFTLSYRSNNGFENVAEGEVADDNEAGHIGYRGLWAPTLIDTIDLQLGYSTSEVGIGSDDGPESFRARDYGYQYQYLNWERQLGSNEFIQLLFYHNQFTLEEEFELGLISEVTGLPPAAVPVFYGRADEPVTEDSVKGKSERFDLEFRHRVALGEHLKLAWGAAVRQDVVKSFFVFGTDDDIDETSWRAYNNWEWRPAQAWVVNLAYMLEYNNVVDSVLSPRVAVNYHLNERSSFRLSYTLGHRMPSLLEHQQKQALRLDDGQILHPQVFGDADVKEEEIESFELGYLLNIADQLSLDVKLFQDDLNDVIDEARKPFLVKGFPTNVVSRTNTAEWRSRGVEGQVKWTPNAKALVSFAYSFTDVEGTRNTRLVGGRFESLDEGTPKHTASLLLAYRFWGDIQSSAVYSRKSDVDWLRGADVDGYERLDLRLAKDFNLNGSRLQAALVANSLLGDYFEFHEYNQFNERYYLQVMLDLP